MHLMHTGDASSHLIRRFDAQRQCDLASEAVRVCLLLRTTESVQVDHTRWLLQLLTPACPAPGACLRVLCALTHSQLDPRHVCQLDRACTRALRQSVEQCGLVLQLNKYYSLPLVAATLLARPSLCHGLRPLLMPPTPSTIKSVAGGCGRRLQKHMPERGGSLELS